MTARMWVGRLGLALFAVALFCVIALDVGVLGALIVFTVVPCLAALVIWLIDASMGD